MALGFDGETIEIPDVTEPIVGYRRWSFDGHDLFPLAYPKMGAWSIGTVTAVCAGNTIRTQNPVTKAVELQTIKCDSAPSTGIHSTGYGCGIYAYDSFESMLADPWCSYDVVWGSCLLWGKVFQHQKGYRAQYAKVHQLFKFSDSTDERLRLLNGIAERYKVEVTYTPGGPIEDPTEEVLRAIMANGWFI